MPVRELLRLFPRRDRDGLAPDGGCIPALDGHHQLIGTRHEPLEAERLADAGDGAGHAIGGRNPDHFLVLGVGGTHFDDGPVFGPVRNSANFVEQFRRRPDGPFGKGIDREPDAIGRWPCWRGCDARDDITQRKRRRAIDPDVAANGECAAGLAPLIGAEGDLPGSRRERNLDPVGQRFTGLEWEWLVTEGVPRDGNGEEGFTRVLAFVAESEHLDE